MPDPTLSAAIREAYASAPVDSVVLHTLELWHPSWTDPIRVVRDRAALDARIEAGAARNPGEIVTFAAYAFDIVPPDQTSGGLPQATIEIDNVSRDIVAAIDLAVTQTDKITAIYRAYLSTTATDGPETDPPLELTLITVTATVFRVTATAGFPNLLDRKFPRLVYDIDTFPGLWA